MTSDLKLPLNITFFSGLQLKDTVTNLSGEKNKGRNCTQWEFVTSLNKFLSNYVGYPHTSSATTSSLLQPHLRAAAVAAAAASAGSHGHHAGNNVCGGAVAAAERQAAAERSRQMGPNSISRDRSNDSNNGHNSEDDTNLSGVEEMEESITGKNFFLSNPAMFSFELWADTGTNLKRNLFNLQAQMEN